MAKRRRTSSKPSRKQKPKLPHAAEVVAFTEVEEAFFREGAETEVPVAVEGAVTETPYRRPTFWRRLFGRLQSS